MSKSKDKTLNPTMVLLEDYSKVFDTHFEALRNLPFDELEFADFLKLVKAQTDMGAKIADTENILILFLEKKLNSESENLLNLFETYCHFLDSFTSDPTFLRLLPSASQLLEKIFAIFPDEQTTFLAKVKEQPYFLKHYFNATAAQMRRPTDDEKDLALQLIEKVRSLRNESDISVLLNPVYSLIAYSSSRKLEDDEVDEIFSAMDFTIKINAREYNLLAEVFSSNIITPYLTRLLQSGNYLKPQHFEKIISEIIVTNSILAQYVSADERNPDFINEYLKSFKGNSASYVSSVLNDYWQKHLEIAKERQKKVRLDFGVNVAIAHYKNLFAQGKAHSNSEINFSNYQAQIKEMFEHFRKYSANPETDFREFAQLVTQAVESSPDVKEEDKARVILILQQQNLLQSFDEKLLREVKEKISPRELKTLLSNLSGSSSYRDTLATSTVKLLSFYKTLRVTEADLAQELEQNLYSEYLYILSTTAINSRGQHLGLFDATSADAIARFTKSSYPHQFQRAAQILPPELLSQALDDDAFIARFHELRTKPQAQTEFLEPLSLAQQVALIEKTFRKYGDDSYLVHALNINGELDDKNSKVVIAMLQANSRKIIPNMRVLPKSGKAFQHAFEMLGKAQKDALDEARNELANAQRSLASSAFMDIAHNSRSRDKVEQFEVLMPFLIKSRSLKDILPEAHLIKISDEFFRKVFLAIPPESRYNEDYSKAVLAYLDKMNQHGMLPSPATNYLKELFKEIYPRSEEYQVTSLYSCYRKKFLSSADLLNLDLSHLKEDKWFRSFNQWVSRLVPSSEFLALNMARFCPLPNKFESMTGHLQKINIAKGTRKDYLKLLTVSTNRSKKELSEFPLSSLFRMLDCVSLFRMLDCVTNDGVEYSTILTPEILKTFKKHFRYPASLYLPRADIKTFAQLTSKTEEEVKRDFISAKVLCDVFDAKIPWKTYSQQEKENFVIKFAVDSACSDQDKMQAAFRKALQDPKDRASIIEFFTLLLGNDSELLNESNKSKLAEAWEKSLHGTMPMALEKEGGIDDILKTIHALGDGCVYNIVNAMNIAVYRVLLGEKDQDVFQVLYQEILMPVLSDDFDAMHDQSLNPLRNSVIHSYSVSPDQLLLHTTKFFLADKLRFWDLVLKLRGEDFRSSLAGVLPVEDSDNFDQMAAEVLAYAVLKDLIGDEVKKMTSHSKMEETLNSIAQEISEMKEQTTVDDLDETQDMTEPASNFTLTSVRKGKSATNKSSPPQLAKG